MWERRSRTNARQSCSSWRRRSFKPLRPQLALSASSCRSQARCRSTPLFLRKMLLNKRKTCARTTSRWRAWMPTWPHPPRLQTHATMMSLHSLPTSTLSQPIWQRWTRIGDDCRSPAPSIHTSLGTVAPVHCLRSGRRQDRRYSRPPGNFMEYERLCSTRSMRTTSRP